MNVTWFRQPHRGDVQRYRLAVFAVTLTFIGLLPPLASGAQPNDPIAREEARPQRFDPARRVVLTGPAAVRLVRFLGQGRALGFKPFWPNLAPDSRDVSQMELDALEAALLSGLLADERAVAKGDQPQKYYRQYAAALFDGAPAIFVNGVHELYFSGPRTRKFDWQQFPVELSGGGGMHWYAVYLLDRHAFVPLQASDLRHGDYYGTVRFHLVGFMDCHGKDRECENHY